MTREKDMTARAAGSKAKSDAPRLARPKSPLSEAPRIGRRFHRPSHAARALVRTIAEKRKFAEPDVLLRWEEAVGPGLAAVCRPVKVSYAPGALGATLLVRADGAHAPEVEHSKPRIIERINAFYGYRAIARVKLTQATGLRGLSEDASAREHPSPSAPPPAGSAVEKAAALAEGIRDPGLRAAVARMGAWVFSGTGKADATGEASS